MNRLKFFRKGKNLTQREMAVKLGYTLSMYEKVEEGRVRASSRFMERMKGVFPEINIDEIFFNANSNDVAENVVDEEN